MALTLLLIRNKNRIPDGLLLSYPALTSVSNYFTPSYLYSMDDGILPVTFIDIIQKLYSEKKYRDLDPLVSPNLASSEILSQLPPVRIFVGDKDPLHDECWRLMDRLRKLEKNVKLTVYKGLHHGYLNMATPVGMKEA